MGGFAMNCNLLRLKSVESYYGELPAEQQEEFKNHLASCPACAAEYEKMRSVLDLMKTRKTEDPGSEFWDGYYARLELRKRKMAQVPKKQSFMIRPAFVYQLAAALILVGFGVIIGKFYLGQNAGTIAKTNIVSGPPQTAEIRRAHDFLDRSQVLLLGIVNGSPEDLVHEKQTSHELIHEASLVKTDLKDPKDRRLKELVSELEIILLQIANLEEQNNLQAVEMVRSGVDRKGVLLKINLEQMRLSDLAPARPDPRGRRKNVY
jgi:hypothetical protein